MKKKIILVTTLSLLLLNVLSFTVRIPSVKASGTIYIRANGLVESTDKITNANNVTYTFTGNINGSIVVKRNNIVVDGAGYILRGTGTGYEHGITISERSNVTIKNVNVQAFYLGIYLNATSHNLIYDNNIIDNSRGIWLLLADNNTLTENNVVNNDQGIILYRSRDNIISENNVSDNWDHSIYLDMSFGNKIYHNTFLDNGPPYIYQSVNIWDDGYPSGGNYWSDYEERYPDAEEIDESGIWNTPYAIDENNTDNYPIVPEFSTLIILPLFMIVTLLVTILFRKSKLRV